MPLAGRRMLRPRPARATSPLPDGMIGSCVSNWPSPARHTSTRGCAPADNVNGNSPRIRDKPKCSSKIAAPEHRRRPFHDRRYRTYCVLGEIDAGHRLVDLQGRG